MAYAIKTTFHPDGSQKPPQIHKTEYYQRDKDTPPKTKLA